VRLTRALAVGGRLGAARLVLALLGVYELRYLLASVWRAIAAAGGAGSQASSGSARWVLVAVAFSSAVTLQEMTRGLRSQVARPSWSLASLQLWLLYSGALLAVLCGLECSLAAMSGHGTLMQVFASVSWWAIPAVLLAGLLLVLSVHGARWVLSAVARWRRRPIPGRGRPLTQMRPWAAVLPRAPTPLIAGWSDRGPPRVSRLQVS
jgi:hypothetical protein